MIRLTVLYHVFGGVCFYCGRMTRNDGAPSRKGEARGLSATREHLLRIADGGGNGRDNLALACLACNHGRGATPSLLHFANMRAKHKDAPLIPREAA